MTDRLHAFGVWCNGDYSGCVRAADTDRGLTFFLGDRITFDMLHQPEDTRIHLSWVDLEDGLWECAPAYDPY